MRMTDIVSNLDLSIFPIIALIMFLVAFGIIAWRVVTKPRVLSEHESMLPLLDDTQSMNTQAEKGDRHG